MNDFINDKDSLLKKLKNYSKEIKLYGVKNLQLFGSFAKNTNINEQSDIDFMVEFEAGKKTYDNFINLSFFLEKILNRKVELLTLQSLSKYSGHRILNELEDVAL
jgi:uncharacterized protein